MDFFDALGLGAHDCDHDFQAVKGSPAAGDAFTPVFDQLNQFVDCVDHGAAVVYGAAELAACYFIRVRRRGQIDESLTIADANAALGAEEIQLEVDECAL